MAQSEEEVKILLMKVKEESKKVGLKLNIKKTKIMASSLITLWQIERETMEIVTDYFLGPQNKRCLLFGRKAMTNLASILKSTDIILPTKAHPVKALVFPVVMYGCERWTIKKAERQTIDTFELWHWRRLLRVPWTARKSTLNTLWKN